MFESGSDSLSTMTFAPAPAPGRTPRADTPPQYVDYGALTRLLFKHLSAQPGVNIRYLSNVTGLKREDGGRRREEGRSRDSCR